MMTLSAGRKSCGLGRPTKRVTRVEDILMVDCQSFVFIIHCNFSFRIEMDLCCESMLMQSCDILAACRNRRGHGIILEHYARYDKISERWLVERASVATRDLSKAGRWKTWHVRRLGTPRAKRQIEVLHGAGCNFSPSTTTATFDNRINYRPPTQWLVATPPLRDGMESCLLPCLWWTFDALRQFSPSRQPASTSRV